MGVRSLWVGGWGEVCAPSWDMEGKRIAGPLRWDCAMEGRPGGPMGRASGVSIKSGTLVLNLRPHQQTAHLHVLLQNCVKGGEQDGLELGQVGGVGGDAVPGGGGWVGGWGGWVAWAVETSPQRFFPAAQGPT